MIKERIIFGIDRKEISHFTSIELHQTINNHHTFTIKVPHSVIEKPRAYTMENAQSWMWKVVHIALENKNNFLGIITNIELDFNLDHVGSQIILTGFSKTILLESGTNLHSWEDTTLQDMVREVIKSGADEQLQNEIQPEFTHKINYQTQYTETDFQYIQRLAKQYNEWLFYDGEKLFFGKPKNIKEKERIALTFGQDLYTFKLGVKAKQTQFGAFTYNEDYNKLYQAKTQHKVEGLPRLGDQAFDASEKLFNAASLEYGRIPTGDEGFLETILKKRQEAAMADANYITATSGNNKLKIGSIITINAREEKQLSALDPRWTAGKPHFQTQEIGTYIITEITHEATDIGEYENSFKALPAFIKTFPEPQIAFPQAQNQQAIVIDNADPKGQGRIRVKMLWQQTKNLRTQWIRVMTPDAGTSGEVPTNRGMVFIPEIGDHVMLGFRYNDPNRPFVLGSLFNGQTGKGGQEKNHLKSIFTRGGSTITFNELDNSILIKDTSGNTWFMDGAGNIMVTAPKNITMNAGENITMNATDILLNSKNNYLINVANKMTTKVGSKILTQTNELKQVVVGSTSLFSGKTLINSTDGEVKIEANELTASGKKSMLLHSDENFIANSKGDLHIKGEKGNKQSNTATTYTPTNAEKLDAKCIAHFRPTDNFDYEYGFDYMQLDNKIYGGINFYKQIVEEKNKDEKVANHKNFEKLAQEYNPILIPFRPIDPKIDSVLQNYFCSWLSIYPQNDIAGKNTVTLNMLFEADEDMTKPFELEYNKDYFDITPTTFPPIKKTKEGKAVEIENAITITCKKGFTGEYDKTKELNPAEIRVVITSDTEKDDHDKPLKHLAGKLLIKPNSDHDRRKTNVRFVQVLCKTEDVKYFKENIKVNEIKAGLKEKCLSHFLIKPEFETDIKVLDLTKKTTTIDKFLQANPDKTSSLFGTDEKLVKDGDGFYKFINEEYNKKFNPDLEIHGSTDFMGIVILFTNYIWLEKHTETSAQTTSGYAGSKLALIFKNGFNQQTIGHEALHTLNLDHTFPDEEGKTSSKHIFNKQTTKNIMDYAKQNETGADMKETYKWQWDVTTEINERNLVRIDEWETYEIDNQERLKQIEQDKKEAEEKAKKDQSYRNSSNYFNTLDV